MSAGLITRPWLLGLLLASTAAHAAPALEPDFLDYLVAFADDREVFDAADFDQVAAAGNTPTGAPDKQTRIPVRSEPASTPTRKEKHQ